MLGIYTAVPFCKSKCSYCNFASGVFSRDRMQRYVDRLVAEMESAQSQAESLGATFERRVDSLYLGGGTPSLLAPEQLQAIFAGIRRNFDLLPEAEITVECAPGTLSPEIVAALVSCGVNRVSLGVQSFNDLEARSVGRLHTRNTTLEDVARLRSAGIQNINVDLIAGLPHQTGASWDDSLVQAIALEVPHVSVYILEVDEDSRLGRELIAGGQKYHAHHVPDSGLAAELYERACELLDDASIRQYEISNFARAGFESRHNLKYWTRIPYFGFGLDAHSMLFIPANAGVDGSTVAVRLANPVELEDYLQGTSSESIHVTLRQAIEEELFLGLRLNRGINTADISERLRVALPKTLEAALSDAMEDGLLMRSGKNLALTARGRLLSNEVFVRFLDSSRQPVEAR